MLILLRWRYHVEESVENDVLQKLNCGTTPSRIYFGAFQTGRGMPSRKERTPTEYKKAQGFPMLFSHAADALGSFKD